MITILNKFTTASEKVKNLVANKNEPDFPLPEILKNLQKNEKEGGDLSKKQPGFSDKASTQKQNSNQENKASGWSNWDHNWDIDDEVIAEESPEQQKQSGKTLEGKKNESLDRLTTAVTEDKTYVSKNETLESSGWGIDEIEGVESPNKQDKHSGKSVEDIKPTVVSQKWQNKHDKMQKRLDEPVKFTSSETNALQFIVQLQEMKDIMKHEYELFHNEWMEKQKELERREVELQGREAQLALKEKDLELIEKRIQLKQKLQIDNQSLDKTIRANVELEQEARKAKEQLKALQDDQTQLASKIRQQFQAEIDQLKEQHKAHLKSQEQQHLSKNSSVESEAESKLKELKAKHQAEMAVQLNKKESELKALKVELASAQRERDEKEAHVLKLKQSHENEKQSWKKQKEADMEVLHQQVATAHATTSALRQQLVELRNSHQAEMKKLTSQHNDELKKLKRELEEKRESYRDLEKETLLVSKTKKEEIIELSREKDREAEELKSQLQKVNFRLETVQKDKDYLEKLVQEKNFNLENRKAHEQNEITKLLAQNSELKEENQTLQVLITTFKAKLGDLQHNFKERMSVSSSRTGKSSELLPEELHHSPTREDKTSLLNNDSLKKSPQRVHNEEPEVNKPSQKESVPIESEISWNKPQGEQRSSKNGWKASGGDWNVEESSDSKQKTPEPALTGKDAAGGDLGFEEAPYEPVEVQAVDDQNPWEDTEAEVKLSDQDEGSNINSEKKDEDLRIYALKSYKEEDESLQVNLSETSINKRNQSEKSTNPFRDEEIEEIESDKENKDIELIKNVNSNEKAFEEDTKAMGDIETKFNEINAEQDLQVQEESVATPEFIEDSQANQISAENNEVKEEEPSPREQLEDEEDKAEDNQKETGVQEHQADPDGENDGPVEDVLVEKDEIPVEDEKREVYNDEKLGSEAPAEKVAKLIPISDAVEVLESIQTNQEEQKVDSGTVNPPFKNPFADDLDFAEDAQNSGHLYEESTEKIEDAAEEDTAGWENEKSDYADDIREEKDDQNPGLEENKNDEEIENEKEKQHNQKITVHKDHEEIEQEEAGWEEFANKTKETEEEPKAQEKEQERDEHINRHEEREDKSKDKNEDNHVDEGEWGLDKEASELKENEEKRKNQEKETEAIETEKINQSPEKVQKSKANEDHQYDEKSQHETKSKEPENEIQIDQSGWGLDEDNNKLEARIKAGKPNEAEELQIDRGGWGLGEDMDKQEEKKVKPKDEHKKQNQGGWGLDNLHSETNKKETKPGEQEELQVDEGEWGWGERVVKATKDEASKSQGSPAKNSDKQISDKAIKSESTQKQKESPTKKDDSLDFADDWGTWGSKQESPKATKSAKAESHSPNSKSTTEEGSKKISFALNKSTEKKSEKPVDEDDPFNLLNSNPQGAKQPEKKGFVINKNLITLPKTAQNKPLLLPSLQKPEKNASDFNLEDLLGNNFKK